ncbi:MAG: DegT/DnrJ/EryC1/StrS family aminotransferase [Arcicella sp.]|nr:DegT/DnrJ/EryC1/StrS family aminotransferase [Arcicella sp.]
MYGQPCEMDKIIAIAIKYNLFIVEDNAQADGILAQRTINR